MARYLKPYRIDVQWCGDGYTAWLYRSNAMTSSVACGVAVGPQTEETYRAAVRDLLREVRWSRENGVWK